ncbi:MAG TPA: 1-deoxy-D-xylulose-5-phosphate reductoisomerase [Acidimicrobiales bacterium]|jgi:1-deoxy-D-xylulose-5-phosphate reductoisomerase|nr:1-deoxy-D-xylulose-5-phosphate reductoisomerase [Acidimicrobiales bacterium]
MRTVSLMGSTGSVGTQALDVIRREPERFRVHALAAQRSVEELLAQVAAHSPALVVIGDPDRYAEVRAGVPAGTEVMVGEEGMVAAAQSADVVLNAVVGFAGLPVTMAALQAGKRLALANKESLIAGAPVVQKARRTPGAEIVPVDSEHCAVHQCLAAVHATTDVARLLLTASGGPFRGWTAERLGAVTVADALAHPTWSMGPKITVDSSTLMNKGLEVIEAHELFGIGYDRIDIVVHPQSIVHSMVELRDGSTLAQLSNPDMRLPIGYALGWPDRMATPFGALDWSGALSLTFEPPDRSVFACIDLAYAAGRSGGSAPAWLSAANEVAVEAFLGHALPWGAIAEVVAETMEDWVDDQVDEVDAVLAADAQARARARLALDRRLALGGGR